MWARRVWAVGRMSSLDMTWGETMNEVLDSHDVRDPLSELLLWENPVNSGLWFGAGWAMYIMVDLFQLRLMTILGSMAILQLVIYRMTSFLQQRGIAFDDADLREKFILTPDAASVSKAVEVVGDLLRIVEESLKELSLTSDYVKLLQGFSTLVFLSALGRVVRLPILLIAAWTISFTGPSIYMKNQELLDNMMDRSKEASALLVKKASKKSKKRSSKKKSRRYESEEEEPEEEEDEEGEYSEDEQDDYEDDYSD